MRADRPRRVAGCGLVARLALVPASIVRLHGQGVAPLQDDRPVDQFAARRSRVFDAIGSPALAVMHGASGVSGFKVSRQSNEFYHLSVHEVAPVELLGLTAEGGSGTIRP